MNSTAFITRPIQGAMAVLSLMLATLPSASAQFNYDYGDAPSSYGTLFVNNGPHHIVSQFIRLGANADLEPDGQPNGAATGDNNNGTDDEDGVVIFSSAADRP